MATDTSVDDKVDQGNCSVTISSNGHYNTIAIRHVTATVADNDTAAVTISESSGTVVSGAPGAGRTDSDTVVLATRPTGDVTIEVVSGLPTVATVSPATLAFATTTWSTAQTVTRG